MVVLEGVAGKWRDVGELLYVPATAMDVIASESTYDLIEGNSDLLANEAHL